MAGSRRGLNTLALWPWLWRSHWRDVGKRGIWKSANMAAVTVSALFCLPGFLILAVFAGVSLREGALERGLLMAELGLTGVMTCWLILPLVSSSVSGRGPGLELARLFQFPLSILQLFQVGVLATMIQPVYWVLAGISIFALVPLFFAPLPVPGLLAGGVFLVGAAVLSWALGLVMSAVLSSRRGKEVGLGVLAFGGAAIWLFFVLGDFLEEEGSFTFEIFDRFYLLCNAEGTEGLLVSLRDWLPAAWVTGVADGSAPFWYLLALGALLAGGLGAAVLSLRRIVSQPPESMGGTGSRTRAIGPVPGLPVALGAAVTKELRYVSRTLDALMGWVSGAVAATWIILRPDHAPFVIAGVMPAVLFNQMVMPMNNFGLDRAAVDRYRLLPLSDRQVILSKNLAYLLLVLTEVAAPVLVSLVRVGPAHTLGCLCGCLAVCFLTMSWGNFISIKSPAPREFFNFDSKEQAGGALPMIYALAIWVVPGLLWLFLHGWSDWAFAVGEVILLGAAVGIWRAALGPAARSFAGGIERMRDQLAG